MRNHFLRISGFSIFIIFLFVLIVSSNAIEVTAQSNQVLPTPDETEDKLPEKSEKEDPFKPTGMSIMPFASGGPDRFGYTWSDTQPYNWIDVTSGNLIDLSGDDKVSDLIPIGFDFQFYENSYNQLYVTTNGVITFGDSTYSFENREMPFLVEPQNIIAPFWDDLHVPTSTSGAVYYQGNTDRFVIAWHNVARYPNTSDLLTFETILYKNGDICFQYQTLSGILDEATVGIEDADGTDGLTYLHNAPGLDLLEGAKKICFIKPTPNYRVKMLPIYQGGLIIGGTKNFPLKVINTGDFGADLYELLVSPSDPSWNIEIRTSGGLLLPDNDIDGLYETGVIQAGQSISLLVKLIPPENPDTGANTLVNITAYSQGQSAVQWSVKLHGAVPGPFVQGVVIEDAISLFMVWADNTALPVISPNYTGSTIGVTYLPGDQYLYNWEQNDTYIDNDGKNVNFTDLEFSVLNGFGNSIFGPAKLTDNLSNSTYTNKITDRSPVATVTNDGKIGLAWIRNIDNGETRQEQSNVFFAIYDLNDMSTPLVGPINITQNSDWAGSGITDVPTYNSPRLSLSSNSRFLVTWSDSRKQTGGDEENIGFASYTITGSQVAFLENVPGLISTPGSILYRSPDVIGVSNNHVFLSFVREDTFAVTSSVGYLVINSNGTTVQSPSLVPGIQGLTPAAIHFSAGPILSAWLNPSGSQGAQQVTFITVNSSTYDISTGPTELITPNGLSADLISVAEDNQGNAVLSWMDMDIEQSIYYSLVGSNGGVLTSPIEIFDAHGRTITVSKLRASIAAYIGKYYLQLPIIFK